MTDLQELYRTIGRQHCSLGQSYLTLADLLLENETIGPEVDNAAPVAAVVGGAIPEMAVHPPTEPCAPPIVLCDVLCVLAENHDGDMCLVGDGSEIQRPRPRHVPVRDHVHELGSCTHCDTASTTATGAAAFIDAIDIKGKFAQHTAEFAPDAPFSESDIDAMSDALQGRNAPSSAVRPSNQPASVMPAIENAQEPPSRTRQRTRTDRTAKEWANSIHFTNYVMRTEPFKSWPAERQNEMRDKFVEAQPADELMNRWGPRFAKFCGVP